MISWRQVCRVVLMTSVYVSCISASLSVAVCHAAEIMKSPPIDNSYQINFYAEANISALDLVFCIDSTSSMEADIDQIKAKAAQILDFIGSRFADFRVAVIDYRDFSERTGMPDDYPARTRVDFSADPNAVISGIDDLAIGYGGDIHEAVFSGIFHALDHLSGWRENAVRMILLVGDAPPLSPEPNTGYTTAFVAARAFLGGIRAASDVDRCEPAAYSGPVAVHAIATESASMAAFTELSEQTGGGVSAAYNAAEVPDAVMAAIGREADRPRVTLTVTGAIGDARIIADARVECRLADCAIVSYAWDWDNDGYFDETTANPTASHDFAAGGFPGEMRVKATDTAGRDGVAAFYADAEAIIDRCPDDPAKSEPCVCGCGVPDTDADGDGVPDCEDECPNNPGKTEPGACGCQSADTDSDGDGAPDCIDACPDDPGKIAPGACGCGVPDADPDGDGVAKCVDNCPDDPRKTEPGVCGCGVVDADTDGDGTPNCNDDCADDPNKTAPGVNGCGALDAAPEASSKSGGGDTSSCFIGAAGF